jgi:hypothetical protein
MTEDARVGPEESFVRAATQWAGGARGQVLVDAAAQALVDGLDSPTLRILAGAPRIAVDDEATELGPLVFKELNLRIEPRLSEAAIIAAARLVAADLLAGDGTPREATATLCRMYVASGYVKELADFSGFDDWYDMLRDGIVSGSIAEVDESVMRSAAALAHGLSATAATEAETVTPRARRGRGWWRRWKR